MPSPETVTGTKPPGPEKPMSSPEAVTGTKPPRPEKPMPSPETVEGTKPPRPEGPRPSPEMSTPEPGDAIKAQSIGITTSKAEKGPGAGVSTTSDTVPSITATSTEPTMAPTGNGNVSMNASAPGNGTASNSTTLNATSADNAFETVTAEMHHEKQPEIPKCYEEEQTVHCGKLQGIYYKKGDEEFAHAELNDLPLDVPAGKKMVVVVCNYHNAHYDPDQKLTVPLLPKIIGDVGERARLSMHIMNSANVDSLRGFKMEMPENEMEPKVLIGPVVHGDIGEGASVRVKLVKSGNVHFGLYAREIELKLASLVGPLVKKFGEKCLEKVCLAVDVVESGNIVGKDSYPEAKLKAAALVQPQVWAQCVKESTVRVAVKSSANIVHCDKVMFDDHAKAVAPLVFAEKAEEVKAKVEVEDSANLLAKTIAITGKEAAVMGPAIKMKETERVGMKVEVAKSANMFAEKDILISGAKVMSEVVEVKETKKGAMTVEMGSSGNLIATYGVQMEGGAKCLDSLIKLKENNQLTMGTAKAVHVCNIWSRDIGLKDESLLVEYLINAEKPYLSAFATKFMGVANAQMKRDMNLAKSALFKSAIEIEDAKGKFLTKIEGSYSGNALCYSAESAVKFEDESVLVGEILEVGVETKEPSVVNAEIRLEYVGNAWAKTHSVTEFVKAIFEQDEVGADRVSIGQNKVGKKLVCVPHMDKDAKNKL